MRFHAVVVLAILLLGWGRSATGQTNPPQAPGPHLVGGQQVELRLPDNPPDRWHLALPLGAREVALDLQPHSLRADGFRVLTGGETLREHPVPPVRTYRAAGGSARAAVSLGDDGVRAVIRTDGGWWFVQPSPGGQRGQHVVYRATDIDAPPMACEALRLLDDAQMSPERTAAEPDCQRIAEIAFDADTEFFALNGSSVDATVADIEGVLNAVDLIYNEQLAIGYSLTTVIVRTEEPDPYSAQTMQALLQVDMVAEWAGNLIDVPRDIAHLMTGRSFGNTIGIAVIGDVCSAFSLGVSRSRWTDNWGLRTSLTAHELGHNWDADHCNGDNDCGVMCATAGGCANNPLEFGRRSVNSILGYRADRACLNPAPGLTEPAPPIALDDVFPVATGEPAELDVLGNDLDPNCEPLGIAAFEEVTARGGTVELAPGGGPDGRDTLLYTPPAGLTEPDSFFYSAAASDGVSDAAEVLVEFYRRPENPHPAVRGLDATLYDLGFRSMPVLAELDRLVAGPVFELDFPPTTGVFAGSGRADYVAARVTGSIRISAEGLYTLYLSSDEGAVLRVNGGELIDHDGLHAFTERAAEVWLTGGEAALELNYYELTDEAGLVLEIEGPGLARQPVGPSLWVGGTAHAEYFAIPVGVGEPVALASRGYPILGRQVIDSRFSHFFLSGREIFGSGETDMVGVLFDGYLRIPQNDRYTFFLNTGHGDAATMSFAGQPLVTTIDGSEGATISLMRGLHKLEVSWAAMGESNGIDSVTINLVDGQGDNQGPLARENLARLGRPLDDDSDGRVSVIEMRRYLRRFGSGRPEADLTGDGVLDSRDLLAAMNAWESGR